MRPSSAPGSIDPPAARVSPSSTQARLCILAAAILFSTGGAAVKLTALSGVEVAGLRSAVAAAFLAAVCPALRRRPALSTLLVATGYALTMLAYVLANKQTTAAQAVFLQATAPLYLLFLGPLFLRERIARRDLWVFLWMVLGLLLFAWKPDAVQASAPDPRTGNLLGAASGFFWATTVLGLRWMATRGEPAIAAVGWGNALAALFALPFAASVGSAGLGMLDLAVVFWLGLFQIGVAYLLATRGLGRIGAFQASLLFLLEPVLNPVWAFALHGEVPGVWTLVGGALILVASLFSALR